MPAATLGPPAADPGEPTHYVHPGQLFVSSRPCAAMTILGSCVAVCLWDPKLKLGGLNHYLLPDWVAGAHRSSRYGSVAIEELIAEVVLEGGAPGRLEAKVFGGTCSMAVKGTKHDLGLRNVELARRLLAEARIPIVAEDVGGQRGRRLVFHISDGSVWVKHF